MKQLSNHSERNNQEWRFDFFKDVLLSYTKFGSNATLVSTNSMIKKWPDPILSLLIFIPLNCLWLTMISADLFHCSFLTCYLVIKKKMKAENHKLLIQMWGGD